MSKLKITVLKKTFYQDLADEYAQPDAPPCPYFAEGQEFIVERVEKPEGFCTWAWHDIYPAVTGVRFGGNYPWIKKEGLIYSCCSDGVRRVFFNIERL